MLSGCQVLIYWGHLGQKLMYFRVRNSMSSTHLQLIDCSWIDFRRIINFGDLGRTDATFHPHSFQSLILFVPVEHSQRIPNTWHIGPKLRRACACICSSRWPKALPYASARSLHLRCSAPKSSHSQIWAENSNIEARLRWGPKWASLELCFDRRVQPFENLCTTHWSSRQKSDLWGPNSALWAHLKWIGQSRYRQAAISTWQIHTQKSGSEWLSNFWTVDQAIRHLPCLYFQLYPLSDWYC